MESARSKAELAMEAVDKARLDSEKAKHHASEIFLSEPNSGWHFDFALPFIYLFIRRPAYSTKKKYSFVLIPCNGIYETYKLYILCIGKLINEINETIS